MSARQLKKKWDNLKEKYRVGGAQKRLLAFSRMVATTQTDGRDALLCVTDAASFAPPSRRF